MYMREETGESRREVGEVEGEGGEGSQKCERSFGSLCGVSMEQGRRDRRRTMRMVEGGRQLVYACRRRILSLLYRIGWSAVDWRRKREGRYI